MLVGRRWGSGPRGVFFSLFFFSYVELAAENTGWQPAKPAVTQQGID